jgi:PadR family transcriptional regulator, regulatory protein AphA
MSLQYAILGLLGYKSMTGYELKKMFDQSINNFWAAHLSQIYRELGALEKKEFVSSVIEPQSDRPDKRIYSLTDKGKLDFKEWMTNFPEKLSKQTRDEFVVRIFFGSEVGKDELIKQLKRYLTQKQNEKQAKIAEIGMNIKQYANELKSENKVVYWELIEKKAQMTNETLIRWAEECIVELEKLDGGENR